MVPFFEIVEPGLRLVAAVALAGIIGLEREIGGKPIGLRTLILVSLASALFTLAAMQLSAESASTAPGNRFDPGRVLQGIIAGLGMLGAGAILHRGATVRWATTGASVWLAGGLGIACGLGYYRLAAMATGLGLVVLVGLGAIERLIERRRPPPSPDDNDCQDETGSPTASRDA